MNPLLEAILRALDGYLVESALAQVPPAVTADELLVVRKHVELLISELDKQGAAMAAGR